MEFKEASEICRNNPGSYFKRGPTGEFVVHLKSGEIISSQNNRIKYGDPKKINAEISYDEISHAVFSKELESYKNQIDELKSETASQKNTINFLIELVNSQKETIDEILEDNSKFKSDLKKLQKLVDEIPKSEWDRYKEIKNKEAIERREAQRSSLIESAKNGEIDYERIRLILDRSQELNLTENDISVLKQKLIEKAPLSREGYEASVDHGFVVYGD